MERPRKQKYVKKGYMKMKKKIYLETLKSVLGRSILHYYCNNVNYFFLRAVLVESCENTRKQKTI